MFEVKIFCHKKFCLFRNYFNFSGGMDKGKKKMLKKFNQKGRLINVFYSFLLETVPLRIL
jgi:hypothetical protein